MITDDVNGVSVSIVTVNVYSVRSINFPLMKFALETNVLLPCPLGCRGSGAAGRREGEMGTSLSWKISQ